MPIQPSQSGNVLFLILIAVALFAALSYAVTSSTRSGAGNSNSEKTELATSRMMQYVTSIDSAVLRLTLTNGCTINQLSFDPPPFSGTKYNNPAAPANFTCHVFHPNGGAVPYVASMPTEILDPATPLTPDYGLYNFSGMFNVQDIGTTCLAASCNDLVFYTQGFTLDACASINRRLSIAYSVPTDLNEQLSGYEPQAGDFFTGTVPTPVANSGVDQNSRFYGKPDGCIRRHDLPAANNPYGFYHVILAR